MLPRTLEKTLRKALKTFPAVLVTGPRQSGKTTLLSARFKATHRFVSLENPDVRARAIDDPIGFLNEHRPPIILDEIQYTPALLHYIKSKIDEDRRPGLWILSGSQSFPVMQGVSQSLSGRVAVLSLLPLSWAEGQGRGGREHSLDELLSRLYVWKISAVVLDRPGGGAALIRGDIAPAPAPVGAPRINGPVLAAHLETGGPPETGGAFPFRFGEAIVTPKIGSTVQ